MPKFLPALLLVSLFSSAQAAAQKMQIVAHLPYDSATLAGCWHHVDSAGREYALVGTSRGLSIVDLANPAKPQQLFHVPGPVNNWREVRTWGGFAYVGSEAIGSGITIVDLRALPDTVRWKTWTGDGPNEGTVLSSHTVGTADGHLYIFGASMLTNGAIICDLADPWNPRIIGTYSTNYLHDGFVRGDTLWGSEIYEGQFSVIDISDKTAPVLLETQQTPGQFNHNGWLSDDGRTFFTTDERPDSPLTAFDVSDLGNIRQLDTYFPSRYPSREVHNVRGLGNFLVNPSYGGQLTIVDATHPDNLIEVGFASLGSSLVWDADPYLPSGIVVATAKNEGLYILKPKYQQAAYLEGAVTDASTGDSLAGAKIRVLDTPQSETTRVNGIFKTGAAQPGTYTVMVEKPGYASQTIAGVALQTGQITRLDVALMPVVASTQGVGFQAPASVSPTVFRNCLMVDLPADSPFAASDSVIRVSDLSGKTVARTFSAGPRTEICLESSLPAGQYLVFLENNQAKSAPMRVVKG